VVKGIVEVQRDALLERFGIVPAPLIALFEALAGDALQGPFRFCGKRYSAINRDGVPFQWSVSCGQVGSALRFITDCGVPGMSIPERVQHARSTLSTICDGLSLASALAELDRALSYLLPRGDLLEASLMGLCIGVELGRAGAFKLKVYINGEIGDVHERRRRMANCLIAFGRPVGAERLERLAMMTGDRLVPAFSAVDLDAGGIGRIKLYLRPTDGSPELQSLAASAVDCSGASEALALLHRVFLPESGAYPSDVVDMSAELPADDGEPGFKVDLRSLGLLSSDAEADVRIRRLLSLLDCPESDYGATRDVVVGTPSTDEVRQIVFTGLACRRTRPKVDVYFHPCPVAAPSLETRA
jgi:hypothetical protein